MIAAPSGFVKGRHTRANGRDDWQPLEIAYLEARGEAELPVGASHAAGCPKDCGLSGVFGATGCHDRTDIGGTATGGSAIASSGIVEDDPPHRVGVAGKQVVCVHQGGHTARVAIEHGPGTIDHGVRVGRSVFEPVHRAEGRSGPRRPSGCSTPRPRGLQGQ